MDGKAENAPFGSPKPSSPQEQPPSSSPATAFPDWASFQAYYSNGGAPPVPPSGYCHSPVASSSHGHPYIWGGQHMIPTYGTPPHPYVAVYPHGGIYPHPCIPPGSHPYGLYPVASPIGSAEASVSIAGGGEAEGKPNGNGKIPGASANGDISESGESGSEGSSEESDPHSDVSEQKQQGGHGSTTGDAQPGNATGNMLAPGDQTTVTTAVLSHATPFVAFPPGAIPGPTISLNIGTDYWGGSSSSLTSNRSKLPVKTASAVKAPRTLPNSCDGVPSDLWLQDEREIKRQRRKQSNRESARRSRLRKQAECEELAQRVGTLKEENEMLTQELQLIREDCSRLASENASLSKAAQQLKGKEQEVDEGSGQPHSCPEVGKETVEDPDKPKAEAAKS